MELRNFRQPDLIREIVHEIGRYSQRTNLMEVCGTHTMAIGQWGIRRLLPENIRLISGPGCPVCVTPISVIDELIRLPEITIATFGDLLRVPGSSENLEHARGRGAKIVTLYSPLEALELAKKEETIFVGIGFETTIPGIAYTILEAKRQNLTSFSVLPAFKLVPPALDALLGDEETDIHGLILPGHVSVVTGTEVFEFIPQRYQIGGVVTGFEPLDILLSIKRLMENLQVPQIINEYSRVVTREGNHKAIETIMEVFEVSESLWRGLGWIPASGLSLREEYSRFDAQQKYGLKIEDIADNPGCRCGDVLKGKIIPLECSLFAKACDPQNPIGPCMVSSEGSCAAYYKYER